MRPPSASDDSTTRLHVLKIIQVKPMSETGHCAGLPTHGEPPGGGFPCPEHKQGNIKPPSGPSGFDARGACYAARLGSQGSALPSEDFSCSRKWRIFRPSVVLSNAPMNRASTRSLLACSYCSYGTVRQSPIDVALISQPPSIVPLEGENLAIPT